MRIGVTYENGEIFQHFGHTETFKLYDVENRQIKNTQVVDTNGQGHSALASFLTNAGESRWGYPGRQSQRSMRLPGINLRIA